MITTGTLQDQEAVSSQSGICHSPGKRHRPKFSAYIDEKLLLKLVCPWDLWVVSVSRSDVLGRCPGHLETSLLGEFPGRWLFSSKHGMLHVWSRTQCPESLTQYYTPRLLFWDRSRRSRSEGMKLNSQQAVVKGTQMEELSNLRSRGKENSAQRIPFL